MIEVGVNGYGTIGKRVADAVAAQPDMGLAGVARTGPDYEAEAAVRKGRGIRCTRRSPTAWNCSTERGSTSRAKLRTW